MKKIVKRTITIGVISTVIISAFIIISKNSANGKEYDVDKVQAEQAYSYLKQSLTAAKKDKSTYYDFMLDKQIKYDLSNIEGKNNENNVSDIDGYHEYLDITAPDLNEKPNVNKIEYGDHPLTYEFDVKSGKGGLYYLSIDYNIIGDVLSMPTLSLLVNGKIVAGEVIGNFQYTEQETIDLPLIWTGTESYETGEMKFSLDSFGDETVPLNTRVKGWNTFMIYDNQYSTSHPLVFDLKEGHNTIIVSCVSSNSPLLLGRIQAVAPKKIEDYQQYRNRYQAYNEQDALIKKNAIYYHQKNSSYLSLKSENSPSVKPFSANNSKLNIFSGDSWNKPGQEITYKINVPQAGMYKIAFHYENSKQEYNIFRSIYVNGKIPFKELENYQFKPTSTGSWSNQTLNDGKKNYLIFLNKGDNTLALKAEMSEVYSLINKMKLVVDHINYFALEILKITGNDIDKNREYKLTQTIKETVAYLDAYDTIVKDVIMEGKQYSSKKTASSTLSYLQKVVGTLNKLRKKPDDLPKYLKNLYSGTSSINQMLGDSISNIGLQPFSLDYIYVYGGVKKLPAANASGWKKFTTGAEQLFDSFFNKKYNQKIDKNQINVWVNRPLTYINIMQSMVDREFNSNPDYKGPKIRLIAMPDASKLILANAAGENPDVALGLASYMPFDLAIRNAAYDLTKFSKDTVGKNEYEGSFYQVADRFAPGTLVPFNLGNSFYALPETLDFNVLMYRKDILSSFGIPIPNTWDDVIGILSGLQRYGMNFYMPISADNATKWFNQTSNLIYQQGGKLYSDDGRSTTINSEAGVKGLKLLTDLFKNYSMPVQVPSFYNSFRYGTLPIGIANFTNYLQMKNAAPELIGKWDIALPIGTARKDDNGQDIIDRTYISSGSAGMIFGSTEKPQESWDFLSWWTHSATQIEFANTLQSTYGPEYVWMSGNLQATADSSLDSRAKSIIVGNKNTKGALDYITDVPRSPGQYMLERSLSNIWTTSVFDNTPVRIAIDQQITLINREIIRKLTEFGYITANGETIKEYYIHDKDWIIQLLANARIGGL